VARPLLAVVVVTAVLAGCSGGDRPSASSSTDRRGDAPADAAALPPELDAFLRTAAGAERASFVATYDVLRKLGGVRSTVAVASVPGQARIGVGDLVVLAGDRPATCLVSAEACVDEVREDRLAPYGVFSRFWSTGPADALRAVVRRADDGRPVRSTRTAAGVPLECVAVPVGSSLPATSCITPEGVFGYVDDPSVRYELTSYRAGPPAGMVLEVPFPVTDDDAFLLAAPAS